MHRELTRLCIPARPAGRVWTIFRSSCFRRWHISRSCSWGERRRSPPSLPCLLLPEWDRQTDRHADRPTDRQTDSSSEAPSWYDSFACPARTLSEGLQTADPTKVCLHWSSTDRHVEEMFMLWPSYQCRSLPELCAAVANDKPLLCESVNPHFFGLLKISLKFPTLKKKNPTLFIFHWDSKLCVCSSAVWWAGGPILHMSPQQLSLFQVYISSVIWVIPFWTFLVKATINVLVLQ